MAPYSEKKLPLFKSDVSIPIYSKKIIVFDSGAGGLSIACGLIQAELNIDLVYFSDTERFPYGTLSSNELLNRVGIAISYCIEKEKPDAIIIACNTASTIVLSHLRTRFSVPFIGVVPAIKTAAKISKLNRVAVLATQVTSEGLYLSALIEKFAQHKTVYKLACPELVHVAEDYIKYGKINPTNLDAELERISGTLRKCDVAVLACTHFPLISFEIKKILKNNSINISLIDSSDAIVNRAVNLLDLTKIDQSRVNRVLFLDSANALNKHYQGFIQNRFKEKLFDFNHFKASL